MNNCFCELPQLENPFSAEEILSEEDIDLIYNYSHNNLNTENIRWHDSTDDFYSGKTPNKKMFSGVGYITNKAIMRKMYEFVHDRFNDSFIKEMWNLPTGHKLFPCTLLAWNESSDWHCEGVQYKIQNHPDIAMGRFSTVCNFRLLGDTQNSKIFFANASDKLVSETEKICQKYIDSDEIWIDSATKEKSIFSNIKPRAYNDDKSLMTGAPNDYFCKPDVWENELDIVAVKENFENPFLLNLARWHKVYLKNTTPRVTLRLMADKDVPFSVWEDMVEQGTFLK
jgi:hypothetical protein